jgi:hypothetical protein
MISTFLAIVGGIAIVAIVALLVFVFRTLKNFGSM